MISQKLFYNFQGRFLSYPTMLFPMLDISFVPPFFLHHTHDIEHSLCFETGFYSPVSLNDLIRNGSYLLIYGGFLFSLTSSQSVAATPSPYWYIRATPQKNKLSDISFNADLTLAPAAVAIHTPLLSKYGTFRAMYHPPISIMVKKCFHCTCRVIYIHRTYKDNHIRSIHRLYNWS